MRPFFDLVHLIYSPEHASYTNDASKWAQLDYDRPIRPIIHSDSLSIYEKEQRIFSELINSPFKNSMVVKYPSRLSGKKVDELQAAMDSWGHTIRSQITADWKLIYLLDDVTIRTDEWIPSDAYIVSRKGAEDIILRYQNLPIKNQSLQIYQIRKSV